MEVKDLLETIKHCLNKLKNTEISGMASHVHGLDDLILLKCPYHPKWSTNSM